MKQGIMIILTGPVGVGKGTLKKQLYRQGLLSSYLVKTDTTRVRKLKERQGENFYFRTEEEFQQKLVNGDYLYTSSTAEEKIGIQKNEVFPNLAKPDGVLIDLEVEQAREFMKLFTGMYVMTVFLLPPSKEELYRRISLRKNYTDISLDELVENSFAQGQYKDEFDVVLTNYNIQKTAKRFLQALENRKNYIEAVENGKEVQFYTIKRP